MPIGEGFVDLRINNRFGQTEEGFWPSFTDIMTVVVMVFLLASVVMLLRNIELVKQLRATMEAERQAAQIARSTAEEKDVLAARLERAERELAALRLEMLRARETVEGERTLRARAERELAAAREERTRLVAEVSGLRESEAQLAARVHDLGARLTALKRQHQDLAARHREAQDELGTLRGVRAAQEQELTTLRKRVEAAESRLARSAARYQDLKFKYDRLIKPARTTRGKYVVEVRYLKRAGRFQIGLKTPRDSGFKTMERQALEARLAELKQVYSGKLYVKVIIPQDSGLSYNEAWSFTNRLLSRYDYYYQD